MNENKKKTNETEVFKLLNKFNFPKIHSLRVYLSFIWPLLEYACLVWQLQLSNELSDKIESVQKRSLRIIYKEGQIPYSFLLKSARITTLKERRKKFTCFSLNQSFPIPVLRTYSLIFTIPFQQSAMIAQSRLANFSNPDLLSDPCCYREVS